MRIRLTFDLVSCALALAFSTSFALVLYTVVFRRTIPHLEILYEHGEHVLPLLFGCTALEFAMRGRTVGYVWRRLRIIALDLYIPVFIVDVAILFEGPFMVNVAGVTQSAVPISPEFAAAGALVFMLIFAMMVSIAGFVGLVLGRYFRGENILGR